VLRLFLLVLLGGCAHAPPPKPAATNLHPEDRDWLEVYHYEMRIASENEDNEAYYFFLQEIIKEKYYQQTGKRLSPNPRIQPLK
jgi:hypothetical protein